MTAPNPARNALKHGFCSSHFVAQENANRLNLIRQELVDTYTPALDEEFQIINELALARLKVYENEKILHGRTIDEKADAPNIFSAQARTAHLRTVAEWRKEPAVYLPSLMTTPLGVELLLNIWRELAAALQTANCTVSLTQACDAALALGSHWQIQKVGRHGRRVIGLYLALLPDPEREMTHWVELSKGASPTADKDLADEIYALAPSADRAKTELEELARSEIQRLEALQSPVTQQSDLQQELFTAKSCGLGLTDPGRQNEARLFLRYYFAERNRADKLQKRLEQFNMGLNLHRKEKALMAMKIDLSMAKTRPAQTMQTIPNQPHKSDHIQDPSPVSRFHFHEFNRSGNRHDLTATNLITRDSAPPDPAEIITNQPDVNSIKMQNNPSAGRSPVAQPHNTTTDPALLALRLINPAPTEPATPLRDLYARPA